MGLTDLLLILPPSVYALVLIYGWLRLRRTDPGRGGVQPVTVVIPVRNEADRIDRCLQALAAQRFPMKQVQVVVVDDRSEDGTPQVARGQAGLFAHFELIQLSGTGARDLAPKKEALLAGLARAEHELVALLDGDCVPAPTWLGAVTRRLDSSTAACAGPVLFRDGNLWSRVQELEFLGLQTAGWLALALGQPLSASAANLAFRVRGALSPTALRPDLASGDDVFLVQTVAGSGRVRPLVTAEAVVWTNPPESIPALLQQRLRWASKVLGYGAGGVGVLASIYLYHVLLLSLPVAALVGAVPVWTFVSAFALKFGADLFVMAWVTRQLGIARRLVLLPLAELLQWAEILLAPLAFVLPFEWKGRRYRPGGRVAG